MAWSLFRVRNGCEEASDFVVRGCCTGAACCGSFGSSSSSPSVSDPLPPALADSLLLLTELLLSSFKMLLPTEVSLPSLSAAPSLELLLESAIVSPFSFRGTVTSDMTMKLPLLDPLLLLASDRARQQRRR